MSYYNLLVITYSAAFLMWFAIVKRFEALLYAEDVLVSQQKSWRDLLLLIICAITTLIFGRAYSHGIRLDSFSVGYLKVGETINQLFIYLPFVVYGIVNWDDRSRLWLPRKKILIRFSIGLVLGLTSILLFSSMAKERNIGDVIFDTYHIKNFHHAVQVFLEDMLICMLLASFQKALGNRYALLVAITVAALFGFGHIPSRLEDGQLWNQAMMFATLDTTIGVAASYLLLRNRDFTWLFPIHYSLDMMQFYSGISPD